jgi:hypothetical protein
VLERYATWADIRQMTIDEVDLMNIALDEWQEAPKRAGKH